MINRKYLLAACLLLVGPAAWADAQRVGDFALLDHNGKFQQLSYYGDQQAVVITAQANREPATRLALRALQHKYAGDNVQVFGLNSEDGRAAIAGQTAAESADVSLLVDEAQLVAQSLGLSRLGESLLIDPVNLTVLYRGDVAGLDAALQALLAGQPMPEHSMASGVPVAFSRAPGVTDTVSYSRDIVPILKDNCVSCHYPGGIGSWAMTGHAMVQGWSPMIREVVMTRRMPPGQIDQHVSKPIANVAGLSVAEKQMLIDWIDAGSPNDTDVDPLGQLQFSTARFTLGEPDLVFKVPAQSIPATGLVDYRYVPVELNLDRDVWVRAMEFVPGDKQVLHHVIAYVSSPADKTVRGRQTGAAQGESVGGFAPGREPDQFRDNSGRLLKKGSNLLLQMHYTTSGKATVDETEVAIYLHDQPPAYVMSGGVAGERRFLVPPGAKEHKLSGEQLIERDAYLYELNPHMHFRGKYMSFTAHYPDGRAEQLLSVPKYDFNWQFNYVLAEPLFLPAGTRLVADGAMDNSARNPANPDPAKPVHFGLQTKHEMFFGFTTLRYVGDTPANIQAGTAVESSSGVSGR